MQVVGYGLSAGDVVRAVAKAMEVLSGEGAKAADYAGRGAGAWCGVGECDDLSAVQLWEAVLQLPAAHNLALMWVVLRDNPRMGESVLDDLTCFVAHHIKGGDKFGREGLRYWVRHWARRDGSSREAALLYGRTHDTHHRFYRERVQVCLDGWYAAARGALEPKVAELYGKYIAAA